MNSKMTTTITSTDTTTITTEPRQRCQEAKEEANGPSDAMACSPSSLTPETNALANEIYSRGIRVSEIRMLQHAREMERERNEAVTTSRMKSDMITTLRCELEAALDALNKIESHYVDGDDTHEDWKAMGEIAATFLAENVETLATRGLKKDAE